MSDRDEGVEMLREANAAFGNYTATEATVPEISDEGRDFLKLYAEGLASLAANMKQAAAKFKAQDDEMAALLIIRVQLSVEETGEWAEALASGDIVKAAAELADIQYVTDGHYLTLGLGDLKLPLYRETHRANMSKLDEDGKPIISEAGRWIKGPNFVPADIAGVLDAK